MHIFKSTVVARLTALTALSCGFVLYTKVVAPELPGRPVGAAQAATIRAAGDECMGWNNTGCSPLPGSGVCKQTGQLYYMVEGGAARRAYGTIACDTGSGNCSTCSSSAEFCTEAR